MLLMTTAAMAQSGSYSGFNSNGGYYFGNYNFDQYGGNYSGFDANGRYNYGSWRNNSAPMPYYRTQRTYRFNNAQRLRINRQMRQRFFQNW